MSNPFAAKESGMSAMLSSMLPSDIVEAIKIAKTQLPAVIEQVQQAVTRIESKLDVILVSVTAIRLNMDPEHVPDSLPVMLPNGNLFVDGAEIISRNETQTAFHSGPVSDMEVNKHGGGNSHT